METIKEKKYSWFPENGRCIKKYGNVEDAILDAEERFNERREPYDDNSSSSIINVGEVRKFDLKKSVKEYLDGIEEAISDKLDDFTSTLNDEFECYIPKKSKAEFMIKANNVLYPLISKYLFIWPDYVCGVEVGKYDLKNKCWVTKK
jgi:hypothetical protein